MPKTDLMLSPYRQINEGLAVPLGVERLLADDGAAHFLPVHHELQVRVRLARDVGGDEVAGLRCRIGGSRGGGSEPEHHQLGNLRGGKLPLCLPAMTLVFRRELKDTLPSAITQREALSLIKATIPTSCAVIRRVPIGGGGS